MRRRYIAALSVIVPTLILAVINYFYPIPYEILYGYMVAVALLFKGALVSLVIVSKLKIIAFLKKLTLLEATILLVKRWLLDNVLTIWIKENIMNPLVGAVKNALRYYSSLNLRRKLRSLFMPILAIGTIFWLIINWGYLDDILLFTELKVFIVGFSKTVLLILSKVFGFIVDSWISPIFEVFALSYLLTKLEDWLGKENIFVRAINWLGKSLNRVVSLFVNISRPVKKRSRVLGRNLNNYIDKKRGEYEYEQFERLETQILKGHIDAYYTFKGIEKIKDKKRLYTLINERTKDYLDIVAFLSRDRFGNLVPEDVEDSYYHDLFILEGVASSHKHGVKRVHQKQPDSSDFWILNSSNYPIELLGTQKYDGQIIEPKSVTFIKTKEAIDYKKDRICFKFKNQSECAVILEEK